VVARCAGAPKNLVRQQAERVSMRSTLASQTTPAFIQSRYNVTIAPSQSKNIQVSIERPLANDSFAPHAN